MLRGTTHRAMRILRSGTPRCPPAARAPWRSAAAETCQAAVPNVAGSSTASDTCDASAAITQSPAAGTLVGLGVTTITLTATDDAGNFAETSTTFTVEDTTAPVISSVPGGGDLGCNPSSIPSEADVKAGVEASDNCSGSVTITVSHVDSGVDCEKTRKFTITATDQANNPSAPRSVTYWWTEDTTNPTITCPDDVVIQAVGGSCTATIDLEDIGQPVVDDHCAPPEVTWVWSDDAEALDAAYPVGCTTITWTATDACGNTAECTQLVLVEPDLPSAAYTGDTLVFTAGPTAAKATVLLKAELGPWPDTACLQWSDLQVKFEVWSTAVTPALILTATSAVDATGKAEVPVTTLSVPNAYYVKAFLVYSCGTGTFPYAEGCVQVDFGSTNRRMVGGGWVQNLLSSSDKGTFCFVANYNVAKNKVTLTGNSVYMIHGDAGYNWKVKDTAWAGAIMSFYHNPANSGTLVDSGRVQFKGVIQKIDAITGDVVDGFGNATIILDGFDGDLHSPARKDGYSIRIYNGSTLWDKTTSVLQPLGSGGPGGGNIKVFSK